MIEIVKKEDELPLITVDKFLGYPAGSVAICQDTRTVYMRITAIQAVPGKPQLFENSARLLALGTGIMVAPSQIDEIQAQGWKFLVVPLKASIEVPDRFFFFRPARQGKDVDRGPGPEEAEPIRPVRHGRGA